MYLNNKTQEKERSKIKSFFGIRFKYKKMIIGYYYRNPVQSYF